MSKMKKLTKKEIVAKLNEIGKDWIIEENYLCKKVEFENFIQAFSFMTTIAFFAEKINHHPNWYNVYNKITIKLSTHDCDGITKKDFELAKYIDKIILKKK